MPTIRKITAEEAAYWERVGRAPAAAPDPAQIAALLAALADRRGITRIDRDGPAGGEHAFRGRVYVRGIELHAQFADSRHGGPAGALQAAVAWRDSTRQVVARVAPVAARPLAPARVVRAEYRRMCGWLAYAPPKRRYFADSTYGGRESAEAAARDWLQERQP
ncbi:MAG: hypothetical protein IPP13_22000 [Kouleothrix sp.]|jgi:hypothetical protein|nr:hypothetical protein [Kouleothrix sp.]